MVKQDYVAIIVKKRLRVNRLLMRNVCFGDDHSVLTIGQKLWHENQCGFQ